jgi:hypothetical protein
MDSNQMLLARGSQGADEPNGGGESISADHHPKVACTYLEIPVVQLLPQCTMTLPARHRHYNFAMAEPPSKRSKTG